MKYALRLLIFAALAFVLLPGASCPRPDTTVQRTSPKENLEVMAKALEKNDYATAYYCLSTTTRQRYAYTHFKLMLDYTIFGILVKSMLINWDAKSVTYFKEESIIDIKTGETALVEKARVTLRHWKHKEYTKEFIFVYEDNEWRIELTMAHLIGMPQEDEDSLFLPKTE